MKYWLRSLTTFKRDFNTIYGATPQRWLTKKRLKLAHYLLSENKQKPVEVYQEVRFESVAFLFCLQKSILVMPTKR